MNCWLTRGEYSSERKESMTMLNKATEIENKSKVRLDNAKSMFRQWQDSNLRGETPADFESAALTPRPHCHVFCVHTQQYMYTFIYSLPIFISFCHKLIRIGINIHFKVFYLYLICHQSLQFPRFHSNRENI
jgi:hypothetical protein